MRMAQVRPIDQKFYGHAKAGDPGAFSVVGETPEGNELNGFLREYTLQEAATPDENGALPAIYIEVRYIPYARYDWWHVGPRGDLWITPPRRFLKVRNYE